MSDKSHYDAIVIGAGQGGGPLSTALAKDGRKTALIERKHVGGTCVNEGCTPTKTMVASARVAHLVRRAADYGVNTGTISIDMARIRERKRDIVESFRSGSEKGITKTDGVDLIMGEASFIGMKEIQVELNEGGTKRLTGDNYFINTGTSPAVPEMDGAEDIEFLDSTKIMELGEVPEHLMVVGGGYVGLEFAQMFRRFGSEVSLVQRSAQLLTREDKDVAEEVADILREDGIEVHLSTEASAVEPLSSGEIKFHLEKPSDKTSITCSHVLFAAGRTPNTAVLNPRATGVKTDKKGYIITDEYLKTDVEGIYALGDVKGGPAFTHISYDDYRILRSNVIENKQQTILDRLVPYTVFIDPELGRVGLTEQQALDQGFDIQVAKLPMKHVARALEQDETRGFMKAIVDNDTGLILGCAILGVNGGEVAAVLQMAMQGNIPYKDIRDGVLAHPTLAESLNNLFMTLE